MTYHDSFHHPPSYHSYLDYVVDVADAAAAVIAVDVVLLIAEIVVDSFDQSLNSFGLTYVVAAVVVAAVVNVHGDYEVAFVYLVATLTKLKQK